LECVSILDEALESGPQKGDRMPVAWGFTLHNSNQSDWNWVGFKPVRLNGAGHLRLCSTRAVQPIEGDHFTKEYTLADIIFWKKVVLAC
jgi:hypothetical protein